MSKLLINQYYNQLDNLIQFGGSRNEKSIRRAFENLLNEYCQTRNFLLVAELRLDLPNGKHIELDGIVKDAIRLDYGYWESKDTKDNLDQEIEKKFAVGYPSDNILFEDTQTAVLIQQGEEVMRVAMRDEEQLDRILNTFLDFTRPEVKTFREAIACFQADLPTILDTLRKMIDQQSRENSEFQKARDQFWQVCQDSIHPNISVIDIHEMIIQHILTEDIFINIFSDAQFHRENNIARQLETVIATFFTGNIKRQTLLTIERYYAVIRRTAASIYNHHEKQKFLKAVYENFYQAYNPKNADKLGIVYTPNEIVRFMVESTDYLLNEHFNRGLADPDVEILDPATGTGTFITEIIEYLPKNKLTYKYQNEIHCNEVAILPYYIANLNIEYTYQQKMGEYQAFDHICLVDTLDHTSFAGKQLDLFAMNIENTKRIKSQNTRSISVIIGNPPYNANQQNENDNNKNRLYAGIDERIKQTYIQASSAQKTKVYDMYARFFRWATDRLNDSGIIAFITNSSFIEARSFDGFRKLLREDFSHIYIVDLGGNIRQGDKTGNVFNVKVGIAITFLVKKVSNSGKMGQVYYTQLPDLTNGIEKLKFISQSKFAHLDFQRIQPDENNHWLHQSINDFSQLIQLFDKDKNNQEVLFHTYSNGISTNRDEWVYDLSKTNLDKKVKYFISQYNQELKRWQKWKKENKYIDNEPESSPTVDQFLHEKNLIKWSARLKRDKLRKGKKGHFNSEYIQASLYRPYNKQYLYFDYITIDLKGNSEIFQENILPNQIIAFSGQSFSKPFQCLVSDQIISLDCLEKTQCLPFYLYNEDGEQFENITDWGLSQFQEYYGDRKIKKIDIFYYVYAVLHNPEYRQKYEQNLKRDFPRIPYYADFKQWAKWGKKLMDLHINYETAKPYKLKRVDLEKTGSIKPKLKADPEKGIIYIDDATTLTNIPAIAWEYKLGNRSALDWVLDQYKEKKIKDSTINEKFNNYRFADYKESVIELLAKVCTVSIETMKIIEEMGV